MGRFARGNIRFNFDDMREKYKQYCQSVFALQNRHLSSTDVLSTDEDSDDGDSDNEDMATRLEKMLNSQKGGQRAKSTQKPQPEVVRRFGDMEDEEEERRALQRLLQEDGAEKSKDVKPEISQSRRASSISILAINPHLLPAF